MLAVTELQELFPGRLFNCFLSIGTGVGGTISGKGDLQQIALDCENLITSCERVHGTVGREFLGTSPSSPYFRYSVDRWLGNIALDEWNRVKGLMVTTDKYMRLYHEEIKTERCVAALEERAVEVTEVRREAEE